MRRRLLVGLVALALTLAACGGDDEGGAGGGAEQQQYSLTLIQGVKGDQFYVTMECGAREAAQAAGATLEVAAPDEFDASSRPRSSTPWWPRSPTRSWSPPPTPRP